MAFTWKLNARYATAKPIFGIVASAGIDAKVIDAEPGMQDVILTRGTDQVVFTMVDPNEVEHSEHNAWRFPAKCPGYLVVGMRPGWLLHFKLEILHLLRKAGFLISGPADPPPNTKCPECDRLLRTAAAKQCFHCGADWHERPTPNLRVI